MSDLKVSEYSFLKTANTGVFGKSYVQPEKQEIVKPKKQYPVLPKFTGGVTGGSVPYNPKIQPVDYSEVTAGVNLNPWTSFVPEGALGPNAINVKGGVTGGLYNSLA